MSYIGPNAQGQIGIFGPSGWQPLPAGYSTQGQPLNSGGSSPIPLGGGGGVAPNTFGTGSGGFAPTNFYDSLYPYAALPATTALQLALAQYGNQADLQIAQMNAAAAGQSSANSAAAQIAAAQIAAQGGLAQQNVQSGTQANIANTNAMATLIAAAGGDANAIARLNAQNALAASLANQQMEQQVLGALSSTGLRDQLQARAWTRGFAPQPGFGGAMNNWLSGVRPVQAPTASFVPYEYSKLPMATAATASLPSFSMPSFGTGGGFGGGGGSLGSIGDIFGSIYGGVTSALGPLNLEYGQPAAPAAPVAPTTVAPSPVTQALTGATVKSPQATQSAWEQILANPNAWLAKGGTLPKRGALVGEGPGMIGLKMGTAEAIVPDSKGRLHGQVVPLTPMQTGGTLSRERYDAIDPLARARMDAIAPGSVVGAFDPEPTPFGSNNGFLGTAGSGYTPPATVPKQTYGVVGTPTGYDPRTAAPPPGLTGSEDPAAPAPLPEPPPTESTEVRLPGGITINTTSGRGDTAPTGGAPVGGGDRGGALPPGNVTPQTPGGVPITETGQEILNTPAGSLLFGGGFNPFGGFNANQGFDLPEYGLYGGKGPAQIASLFRPGILNPQEQQDIFDLLGIAGYAPQVTADLIARYTPGTNRVRAIGF